jgi:hypothetical protein
VGSHKDHRPLLDFTPAPEPGSMSFACAAPSKSPKRSIVSIFYAVVPQLGVWLCAEYQYLQIKLPKSSEITKASPSAQAFDEKKPMIFEFEINKNN